jgi:hypothetical protein
MFTTDVYDNSTVQRFYGFRRRNIGFRMRFMAKKTAMSNSSLWIVTIVLLALTAWMYFKR